jgi:hypothetical protein
MIPEIIGISLEGWKLVPQRFGILWEKNYHRSSVGMRATTNRMWCWAAHQAYFLCLINFYPLTTTIPNRRDWGEEPLAPSLHPAPLRQSGIVCSSFFLWLSYGSMWAFQLDDTEAHSSYLPVNVNSGSCSPQLSPRNFSLHCHLTQEVRLVEVAAARGEENVPCFCKFN